MDTEMSSMLIGSWTMDDDDDDDDDACVPVHKDLQAWFAVDPVQWEPPQQPVWGKSLSDHVSQLLAHDDIEGGHWHLCLQHPLDLEHKPQENMKQSTRQASDICEHSIYCLVKYYAAWSCRQVLYMCHTVAKWGMRKTGSGKELGGIMRMVGRKALHWSFDCLHSQHCILWYLLAMANMNDDTTTTTTTTTTTAAAAAVPSSAET